MQAGKYVQALSVEVPRKNGWQIAEWAGDATPDKTQRLLNHAVWDEHAAMGIVAAFVAAHLGVDNDPHAVVVLDESGQEKGRTHRRGQAPIRRLRRPGVQRGQRGVRHPRYRPRARSGRGPPIPAPRVGRRRAAPVAGQGARGPGVQDQTAARRRHPHRPAHHRAAPAVGDRRRGVRPRQEPARVLRTTRHGLCIRGALFVHRGVDLRSAGPRRPGAETGPGQGVEPGLVRCRVQRRPHIRLGVDRHRKPAATTCSCAAT